jgi:hypothetical protein
MRKDQKMPGTVATQGRALTEAVSAMSPTAPPYYYTHYRPDVNSDDDWLIGHAFDWVTRCLRDAGRAKALGYDVAAQDLLNVAVQGLSVVERSLEAEE